MNKNASILITGFTTVTECPKSESEVKEASDRLRCENDTNGNNQYMCLRCINSLVEFCNDHYAMAMIDKGTCILHCMLLYKQYKSVFGNTHVN